MNVWTVTAYLGKDAEVRYTQNGTAVCSFSAAVKSGYGDREKTTWVQCALFGKRAEGGIVQYLAQGAHVALSGEAFIDEWTDQATGQPRQALKMRVNDLDLINARGGQRGQGTHQQTEGGYPQQQPGGYQPQGAPQQPAAQPASQATPPQQAPQQQPGAQPAPGFDAFDDDIPF